MRTEEVVFLMDEAFLYILSCFQEGLTDRDISVELLHYLALRGAPGPLSYPLVRFGEDTKHNSNHDFSGRPLKRGESVAVVLTLLCQEGPVSSSRHFFFGLDPEPGFVADYEKVRAVLEEAVAGDWPPEIPKHSDVEILTRSAGGGYHDVEVNGVFPDSAYGIRLGQVVRVDAAGPKLINRFSTDLLTI